MFGQVARAVGVGFICLLVSGGTLEIVRLIIEPTFNEYVMFMPVIPMGAISGVASYGKWETDISVEVIIIFSVLWFAIIFANIAPILLLFLFGGYIAFYAKPFLIG